MLLIRMKDGDMELLLFSKNFDDMRQRSQKGCGCCSRCRPSASYRYHKRQELITVLVLRV